MVTILTKKKVVVISSAKTKNASTTRQYVMGKMIVETLAMKIIAKVFRLFLMKFCV